MVYKWCVVPQCTNTSVKSPHKLFVSVPTNPKRRKMWLQLSRRDPKSILSHTNVFMCEDHFDMKKDTINYMKYKMGFSQKILLADEAVPTKFHCQEDRKRRLSHAVSSRDGFPKRRRVDVVTKYLQSQSATEIHANSLQKDDNMTQDAKSEQFPDIPEGKELIARVYNYLQYEYEQLKKCTGNSCDLSFLANILKRTAKATGVSENTIIAILDEKKKDGEGSSDEVSAKRQKLNSETNDGDTRLSEQSLSSAENTPSPQQSIDSDGNTDGRKQRTVKTEPVKIMNTFITPETVSIPKMKYISRHKCRKVYTRAQLTAAIKAIDKGMSLYKASKTFKVPRTTYRDKRSRKYTRDIPGMPPVLNLDEETHIVDWIRCKREMGDRITKEELLQFVAKFVQNLNRRNPLKNGVPGSKWFKSFMRRHPIVFELL